MTYHRFLDDGLQEYGSFEVFHHDPAVNPTDPPMEKGWYWWACFPGCLPDGEPMGPFDSKDEAIKDAQQCG